MKTKIPTKKRALKAVDAGWDRRRKEITLGNLPPDNRESKTHTCLAGCSRREAEGSEGLMIESTLPEEKSTKVDEL
jgi:hypothetical protein